MASSTQNSLLIKQKAEELGFLQCGIASADHLKEDATRLQSWLDKGYQGEMDYMENHFDKRADPRKLVEGARSVIVVLQNYHNQGSQADPEAPVISKYAWGKDYHKIVRKKLKSLLSWIREDIPECSGRVFVDSAPVMERAWGRIAGLGWIGKHSLLLNRKFGSWFFIGCIICDLELEPDRPVAEYCGDCTRCVDACPTNAILPGRVVDSNKCISYLTIELKGDTIPEEFSGKMENRAFGCDICQDVCPWNKNAHPHKEPWLEPLPGILEMTKEQWLAINEDSYMSMFEGSAVKRSGFDGFRRNLAFIGT